MSYTNDYKGLIWTDHVLTRLKERRLPQKMVVQAVSSPDRSYSGKRSGTVKKEKEINGRKVYAVVKKSREGKWLILSAWVNPPFSGTKDAKKRKRYLEYKKKYKTASFWGKLWLDIKRSIMGG